MRITTILTLLTAALALPNYLQAGSLQVSPVSIELQAPAAVATITLRNEGTNSLDAQIRVFRWSQVNGEDRLEPTDDVVASPPMVTLSPRVDYTVRLVRVTKRPVQTGESYRLLVDELPNPAHRRNRTVALVLRYSIPVFFYQQNAAKPTLAWGLERRDAETYVWAENRGDRHLRISAVKLRDASGGGVSFGDGLAGYVLGRSTKRWLVPGNAHRLVSSGSVVISAQGDHGPIHVAPSLQPLR
jgi:fimbrial chaperone protein